MWKTIDRPGYFGGMRDELNEALNEKYGIGGWKISWEWGSQIMERPEAYQIYEDSYYEFLKSKPDVVEWLTKNFRNVYDNSLTNIDSGFDYNIQEAKSTHLQDISVRRCLMRLGTWFKGDKLLEVRSTGEGVIFSPCKIPFHLPHMIYKGQTKYKGEERDFVKDPPWWIKRGIKDSVEEFYQQNKILMIKV
jgi:hypothetical protein